MKARTKYSKRSSGVKRERGKINLGLCIKFEAKALKVIGYSRRTDRYWEFSRPTVDLIREYKEKFPEVVEHLEKKLNVLDPLQLSEVFPGLDFDSRVRELKEWLATKGIQDFETVPLYCDNVGKETIRKIEELTDQLLEGHPQMQKVGVNGVLRLAVLKPAHAVYRLQSQRFNLGDRVVMVKDFGLVPLSTKGVVVGINARTLDVVWDVLFMSGSTLGDKCSQPRGATVDLDSCLNLSNRQLLAPANSSELEQLHPNTDPHGGVIQWSPAQSIWKLPVNKRPVNLVPNSHHGNFTNSRRSGTPALVQSTGSSSHHRGNSPEEFQMPYHSNVWNFRGRGGSHSFGPRESADRGGNLRGTRGFRPARGARGPGGRGGGQGGLWTAL